jgi:hypothetical protein
VKEKFGVVFDHNVSRMQSQMTDINNVISRAQKYHTIKDEQEENFEAKKDQKALELFQDYSMIPDEDLLLDQLAKNRSFIENDD